MCRRFYFSEERIKKSRLTPPDFNYTPKVFAARTIHRIDLVINPAQLAHSLDKKNKPVCIFLLTTPRMWHDGTGVPLGWFLLFPIVSKSSLKIPFS